MSSRDAPLPYNDSPPRGTARGGRGRDRSRSPVRDARRYDDRSERDYGRERRRHDDRDYGHERGHERERRYERGGYDRGRGGYSRDSRDFRDTRDREWDRDRDRGDRYGGRGGRAGGRDRSRSRERPLDRRAIEEGRRRREEERARGVIYTDDGRKIEPEGEFSETVF